MGGEPSCQASADTLTRRRKPVLLYLRLGLCPVWCWCQYFCCPVWVVVAFFTWFPTKVLLCVRFGILFLFFGLGGHQPTQTVLISLVNSLKLSKVLLLLWDSWQILLLLLYWKIHSEITFPVIYGQWQSKCLQLSISVIQIVVYGLFWSMRLYGHIRCKIIVFSFL